ncbi:MAG: hypothetical protein Q9222_003548 [Ikaeria aurantiellina]
MSSVFTFDPDPPKALISPWPSPLGQRDRLDEVDHAGRVIDNEVPPVASLADFGIDSLDPEPQEGSTEYKLHLLLRSRRSFSALSTVQRISGSHLSKSRASRADTGGTASIAKKSAAPASSNQSRQSRLQTLTTQLLWRLQQSSPHHSASRSDLVQPVLPEKLEILHASHSPGKLLPGLGDSQGALYEIGVADDGTFVGLTHDELVESLGVLRAMASSLGCTVHLLRRVIVGTCQWHEDIGTPGKTARATRTEKVWVAEALVCPNIASDDSGHQLSHETAASDSIAVPNESHALTDRTSNAFRTDQLRVSLTGSTTSGKSSLLGTLSTSTLDNGRGKSRLSLLKHRHEIASGMTSSVTGSLIGYHDNDVDRVDEVSSFELVNYSSDNISSWTDIHSVSDPGRLVLLNDSAGHPRFRRTTVRGLVSWAPHWVFFCIAADNEQDTSGRAGATASSSDILGSSCADVDLAKAHLELCLDLQLPLVVVITKLDLASINALKTTMSKVLSILKAAGRRPEILSTPSKERSIHAQSVDLNDELEVLRVLSTTSAVNACSVVPIVLTSAMTGKGMDKVHALLRHLPIPKPQLPYEELPGPNNSEHIPSILFHVDEIFTASDQKQNAHHGSLDIECQVVLSGYLRHGPLVVGQDLVVGPFPAGLCEGVSVAHEVRRSNSYPRIKGRSTIGIPSNISPRSLSGEINATAVSYQESDRALSVWRRVRICSMRNLKLPVQSLSADQAGTIGLSLPPLTASMGSLSLLSSQDRIRKGMVLMGLPKVSPASLPQAYNGFVALFQTTRASAVNTGDSMIAYIASIRAPASVIDCRTLEAVESIRSPSDPSPRRANNESRADFAGDPNGESSSQLEITCRFLTTQEWFEIGSKVLVMPASGFDVSNSTVEKSDKLSVGLEGYVGNITHGLS